MLKFLAAYLDRVSKGHKTWPVAVLVDGVPDIENITQALREGPYGQCVYEASNDVCDNQVSGAVKFIGIRLNYHMYRLST